MRLGECFDALNGRRLDKMVVSGEEPQHQPDHRIESSVKLVENTAELKKYFGLEAKAALTDGGRVGSLSAEMQLYKLAQTNHDEMLMVIDVRHIVDESVFKQPKIIEAEVASMRRQLLNEQNERRYEHFIASFGTGYVSRIQRGQKLLVVIRMKVTSRDEAELQRQKLELALRAGDAGGELNVERQKFEAAFEAIRNFSIDFRVVGPEISVPDLPITKEKLFQQLNTFSGKMRAGATGIIDYDIQDYATATLQDVDGNLSNELDRLNGIVDNVRPLFRDLDGLEARLKKIATTIERYRRSAIGVDLTRYRDLIEGVGGTQNHVEKLARTFRANIAQVSGEYCIALSHRDSGMPAAEHIEKLMRMVKGLEKMADELFTLPPFELVAQETSQRKAMYVSRWGGLFVTQRASGRSSNDFTMTLSEEQRFLYFVVKTGFADVRSSPSEGKDGGRNNHDAIGNEPERVRFDLYVREGKGARRVAENLGHGQIMELPSDIGQGHVFYMAHPRMIGSTRPAVDHHRRHKNTNEKLMNGFQVKIYCADRLVEAERFISALHPIQHHLSNHSVDAARMGAGEWDYTATSTGGEELSASNSWDRDRAPTKKRAISNEDLPRRRGSGSNPFQVMPVRQLTAERDQYSSPQTQSANASPTTASRGNPRRVGSDDVRGTAPRMQIDDH